MPASTVVLSTKTNKQTNKQQTKKHIKTKTLSVEWIAACIQTDITLKGYCDMNVKCWVCILKMLFHNYKELKTIRKSNSQGEHLLSKLFQRSTKQIAFVLLSIYNKCHHVEASYAIDT